ncbi:MAG: hypothetical protein JKP95_02115 [Oceanicaulis sp.]|nr:hypothetical protein [Oceanicaulis sp.]
MTFVAFLGLLSLLNGELINVSNLGLVPAVLTVCLVGDGLMIALFSIGVYTATYFMTRLGGDAVAVAIFAGLVLSQVFVFLSAAFSAQHDDSCGCA